jgi:lysophospholipase L1-like esterase
VRALLRAALTLALGAGLAAGPTVVAPSIASAAPSTDYVALGDSYSSGTGVGSYNLSSSCQRSSLAYPALWVAQQGAATFDFAACAGATTSSVRSSQLAGLSADTDLVSITVGGNDAGFADTVLACRLGSDTDCFSRLDSASAFIQTTLPGRLYATYGDIHARAPNAQLVVLGYPRLYRTGFCLFEISDTRRTRINAVADLLASVIGQRAAAAGATFVDARGPYSGHEVCSSSPWINGTTWPVGDSYHPNRSGHSLGYLPMLRGVAT